MMMRKVPECYNEYSAQGKNYAYTINNKHFIAGLFNILLVSITIQIEKISCRRSIGSKINR